MLMSFQQYGGGLSSQNDRQNTGCGDKEFLSLPGEKEDEILIANEIVTIDSGILLFT